MKRRVAPSAKRRPEAFSEELPAMIYTIDSQGRLLRVTDRWLQRFGYERDAVIGRRVSDFLTPGCRKLALSQRLPNLWRDGTSDVLLDFVTKAGETVHIRLVAYVERDERGTPVRAHGVLQDINDQVRSSQTAACNQQILRALYEAIPFPVARVDRGGRILEYRPSIDRDSPALAGMAPGACICDVFPPEIEAELSQHVASGLDGGRSETLRCRYFVRGTELALRANLFVSGQDEVLVIFQNAGPVNADADLRRPQHLLPRVRTRENHYQLTERELTVLSALASGGTDKEIAVQLGISHLTVHKHVSNILGRMNAPSRTAACARALNEGLL